MENLAFVGYALLGGLGMYFGIAGVFELVYYRARRARAAEWKCQPARWPTPRMRRREILLGAANMTAGSVVSGLIAAHIAAGGHSSVYFTLAPRGLPFAVATTLVYFLTTDCALYWAHRTYHRPWLFRRIHRWHHRWTTPTAFTAAAMHPLEFFTYQGIMLAPLFFLPLHVAGAVAILVYQNYVALVDHSGVRLHSWLPWQPPTQFHDDHHAFFHVNYGQNLGLWDRLFGTWRREGRVYGETVFGGKGAGGPARPRLVDYSRIDTARSAQREPTP